MAKDEQKTGANRRKNGAHYETVALRYYEALGYEILERNWQAGHREIDLIIKNDTSLVFVEVKGGRVEFMGHPAYRIDERKKKLLTEAAEAYLAQRPDEGLDVFFDALVVVRSDAGEKIERYTNAFDAE
ncbi:MAG: YraN family protein [Candidatus Zixiibacteriota bacterium]